MSNPKVMAYKRENGRVGIRNHVVILPLDDLSNSACEKVAFNIKGCKALPHAYGRLQFGEDLQLFFRTLIGTGANPNVAAVVVIGIGGSYLGTEFVAQALADYADQGIDLCFLSNVDIHAFGRLAARIDPATTLWVTISKSYTTAETMANAKQAEALVRTHGLDPADHFVTVTSKGSPGDDPSGARLVASITSFMSRCSVHVSLC